jgi:hypothetical protein
MGDYHDDSRLVAGLDNPVFAEYRARLAAERGEAEAKRALNVTRIRALDLLPVVTQQRRNFQQRLILHMTACRRHRGCCVAGFAADPAHVIHDVSHVGTFDRTNDSRVQ